MLKIETCRMHAAISKAMESGLQFDQPRFGKVPPLAYQNLEDLLVDVVDSCIHTPQHFQINIKKSG